MLIEAEAITLTERTKASLHRLSKTIMTGLQPPSGAYGFFYYNGHALSLVDDIIRIMRRLYSGRTKLNELAIKEERARPKTWPAGKRYPEDYVEIMHENHEQTEYMKIDLESLYMFGTILLDQWALSAICVGNLKTKRKHPFTEIIQEFILKRAGCLSGMWDAHKAKALWLYYQVRFYRNKFVVHANRPWQRGTTRSVVGEDFNLFTPTPPGWIDTDKEYREVFSLLPLAPKYIQEAEVDYWEKKDPRRLAEILFNCIGDIEEVGNREKIASIFGKIGGSTPSFQVIGRNLLEFILQTTELLSDIAAKNLDNIDLGRPFMNSEQLFSAGLPVASRK